MPGLRVTQERQEVQEGGTGWSPLWVVALSQQSRVGWKGGVCGGGLGIPQERGHFSGVGVGYFTTGCPLLPAESGVGGKR